MFSKLIETDNIELFITKNSDIISDLYNLSFEQLKSEKDVIDEYILFNTAKIQNLNFEKEDNRNFILLLYDFCEQLTLIASMSVLWHIIQTNNKIVVSSRIHAANLFTLNIATADQYISNFDEICNKLTYAIENEEDNDIKALGTFANYYITILGLQEKWIKEVRDKIKTKQDDYPFLKSKFLQDIFAFDITNKKECKLNIIFAKSAYLQKKHIQINFADNNEITAESNTLYAKLLMDAPKDIYEIRKISLNLFQGSNEIFYSLGRGVAIINEEQQLFAYMKSYGNMHFAKCNYAFSKVPTDFFDINIEIIDHGCGQALASMTYLDFLKKQNINQKIEKTTLNEPSPIALKRGALHVKTFNPNTEISTINKKLNELKSTDFNPKSCTKLHLFSNILDIDDYSTKYLANLIKQTFKGINYFLIVSPKISDLKTNRIDSFVKEFEFLNSELIANENKNAGEWKCDWTMVLRLLKVNIT